jgi:hypothetical protein
VGMEEDKIVRSELMRTHIAACKASKMKVEAYCSEHQLKPSNYYYWQKKLQPQQPGKFISITPALLNAPVSITFTNGKRISFEAMPPVEYIQQLMS